MKLFSVKREDALFLRESEWVSSKLRVFLTKNRRPVLGRRFTFYG
jgi:hypothetical protein